MAITSQISLYMQIHSLSSVLRFQGEWGGRAGKSTDVEGKVVTTENLTS